MKASTILWTILIGMLASWSESAAQDAENSKSHLKHQVGFNATETFRLFEKESGETYSIYYRYKYDKTLALRAGVNYQLDTGNNGLLILDIKAGLDTEFKQSGGWRFYAGADITGGVEKLRNSSRRNYQLGLAPFLGILFYIDKHLSISTEPGLLVNVRRFKDRDTFNPNDSETWLEMDIINVGQLIIGIHF